MNEKTIPKQKRIIDELINMAKRQGFNKYNELRAYLMQLEHAMPRNKVWYLSGEEGDEATFDQMHEVLNNMELKQDITVAI